MKPNPHLDYLNGRINELHKQIERQRFIHSIDGHVPAPLLREYSKLREKKEKILNDC